MGRSTSPLRIRVTSSESLQTSPDFDAIKSAKMKLDTQTVDDDQPATSEHSGRSGQLQTQNGDRRRHSVNTDSERAVIAGSTTDDCVADQNIVYPMQEAGLSVTPLDFR